MPGSAHPTERGVLEAWREEARSRLLPMLRPMTHRLSVIRCLNGLVHDGEIPQHIADVALAEWDYEKFPRQSPLYWRERAKGRTLIEGALDAG